MRKSLIVDRLITDSDFCNSKEWFHIDRSDILPHLYQPNKLYFVTFRLSDSIPKEVLTKIREESQLLKAQLKESDSELLRNYNQKLMATIDKYIDSGYGSQYFITPEIRQLMVDTLMECHQKDYYIYDYVLMPNHIHLLIRTGAIKTLTELISQIKRKSAFRINQHLSRTGDVWHRNFFDVIIRSWQHLRSVQNYIKSNPENLPEESYLLVSSIL